MSESRRGASRRRGVVLILILLILLPVVFAGTALASILLIPATAPNTYEEYRAEIGDEIPALMRAHGVPGAAVALVHDGEMWVEGYGSADTERGLPVTDGTLFQAASVSKSVSAWGVMALVEEGRLELDAPVSRYLNRWELPPSHYDESGVTVRRLLSHTAGLSVGGYLGYEPSTDLPSLETELSVGEDAAERPGGVRLVYPPGSESRYSGGGYTLLQLLVEEVTGRPFSEHMEQEVLGPLGMTESTFEWGPPVEEAISTPYGEDGSVLPQYRLVAQAAGGLLTTAPDLARFVAATMPGSGAPAGGGVLDPHTLDLMLSPMPEARIEMGPYGDGANGLGYAIHPVVFGGDASVVGHDGSNQGWKTAFLALPSEGEGLVILTNGEGGGPLVDEVKCGWVGWASRRTVPACLEPKLDELGSIAIGVWLVIVLAVMVRLRRARSSARTP